MSNIIYIMLALLLVFISCIVATGVSNMINELLKRKMMVKNERNN